MVNWLSPETIEAEYESLVKLAHVCDGVYIWEFVTTLDFEWRIFTAKKLAWKWPMGVYILCRLMALAFVITNLVALNVTTRIDCNAVSKSLLTFGYLSSVCASALIVLKTVAIWKHHRVVSFGAAALWLVQAAFFVWAIVKGPTSVWDAAGKACLDTDTTRNRLAYLIGFLVLAVFLVLATVGVWRERESSSGFWRGVVHEGILWMAVAVVVTVLPVVFLYLDLNSSMNLMFDNPACLGLAICATRMYRELHAHDSRLTSSFSGRLGVKFAADSRSRSHPSGTEHTGTTVGGAAGEEGRIHIRTEQFEVVDGDGDGEGEGLDLYGSAGEVKAKRALTEPA